MSVVKGMYEVAGLEFPIISTVAPKAGIVMRRLRSHTVFLSDLEKHISGSLTEAREKKNEANG
jgi:hypothetical protein